MWARFEQSKNTSVPNVGGVVASHVIETKAVQPENAASPILVTPEGNVTEGNEVQLTNVLILMLVTPEGMVIVVNAVQDWNAP